MAVLLVGDVTSKTYIDDMEVNGYKIEPGAHLSRAKLSRANLERANLYGARLSKADLSKADLAGANLTRTALTWADLSGAFADQSTRWPEGFDPVAAGVTFDQTATQTATGVTHPDIP